MQGTGLQIRSDVRKLFHGTIPIHVEHVLLQSGLLELAAVKKCQKT
jgi:hypothetical protein